MPPKKKVASKGKKAKPVPSLIDGIDLNEMDEDQLRGFALKLKEEMDREREERNFYQIERDKIRLFWETSRRQVEELTQELEAKEKEVALTEYMSDLNKKNITQKMKHLQFETVGKLGRMRAHTMAEKKVAQDSHAQQEQQLEKDKRELRRCLREREQTNELQLHQMKIRHIEELASQRLLYEGQAKDARLMHEERIAALRKDMRLACRMEMFEVEERKNTQIQQLVESHELAFVDMKNYYNDITLNNLGLIGSLKEQLEAVRKQSERNERLAREALLENRALKEPLEAANIELHDLRRKLEHSQRDRQQLMRTRQRNTLIERQLKSLTWETEVLLLRNDTLSKERDELKSKFDDVFLELQHKMGLKNTLLQRKIATLEKEGEKHEVLLNEVVNDCGPEIKEKHEKLREKVEQLLDAKDGEIRELRYEVARVSKAHDDMLRVYEAKLKRYNIPKEDLGFEPVRRSAKWAYLCGPAGLVTKNK